jgi:hypothetical protein
VLTISWNLGSPTPARPDATRKRGLHSQPARSPPQPRVYASERSAGGVHVPALTFNLARFEGFTYGTCDAGADRVF